VSLVTAAADNRPIAASLAPAGLAGASIVVGFFVPFIGLPLAMVSMVAVAVAGIQDRRLRYPTIALVIISIAFNLVLVMVALPAARQLVEGPPL
jgi:hypothetical protein